jgi:CRP-like cAMP-binding protein
MSIDAVAALRGTELFRDLEVTLLQVLAEKAVERRLARDEILFVIGDNAKGLYVIVSGSVRAYRTGNDGREQIIHTEHTGSTIGELPVFDGQPYPSTVADEDSVLLFLDKDSVRRLFITHPDISMVALRVLSRRLRKCAELVETISLRAVGQRLAQWLLDEAASRGRKAGRGSEIELTLSREQLASRIGSVREVVSRAISPLEQDGLIRIEDHRIRIPDLLRLNEYLREN